MKMQAIVCYTVNIMFSEHACQIIFSRFIWYQLFRACDFKICKHLPSFYLESLFLPVHHNALVYLIQPDSKPSKYTQQYPAKHRGITEKQLQLKGQMTNNHCGTDWNYHLQ